MTVFDKSEFWKGAFSAALGVSLLSLRLTAISTQSPQRYTEGRRENETKAVQ
jgi:hypothetical protein